MLGFGVGGATGVFGGLFHLLNHALAKSLVFFAAGNVHRRFETRHIAGVRGLTIAQPMTAIAFLIGGLALAGMPPFSIFASELMILSALVTQTFASDTIHVGRFLTITVADDVRSLGMVIGVSVFAVVLFGGLTYRLASMVWGTPPDHVKRGERWNPGHVSLGATAIALVVFGLMLPAPLRTLLNQASQVLITTVTP
jgi:hydrogenase-4 component F